MNNEKVKNYDSLMILIYVIVGLIMVINPEFVSHAVNYVLGSIIIIFGVVFLFKLLQTKQFKQLSRLELLIALMCVAFGLFLIFNSTILLAILPIAAGIIIMLDALIQIGDGFKLKKYKYKLWYVNLLVGLAFLAFSIFIILKSNDIGLLLIRIIGGVLLIDGIFEFVTDAKIKKINDNVKVIEMKEENNE